MSGMENNNATIVYKQFEALPEKSVLTNVIAVYKELFTTASEAKFIERINCKHNVLLVVAYFKTNLVGFKLGYEQDSKTFYSWVGGVLPAYRRKGIAQNLMQLQNYAVNEKGYEFIRTASTNQFKPMMQLNLKSGFDIIDVYKDVDGKTKILFEKQLKQF